MRRSAVHVLLALLLLLTQQIGATHVYSHWIVAGADAAQAERADGRNADRQLAAHDSCAQCLSLAQIAVAIGSPLLSVAASAFSFGPVALPVTLAACLRTTCVFQPRAPPVA